MDTQELLQYWRDSRQALYQALDSLNDAQLDFVPHAGLWSLRETVCHIAEVEEGWFRYQALRELSEWPVYPAREYPTVTALKELLETVHQRTEKDFADDGDAKLTTRISLTKGKDTSLGWIFWHVLEHEIHHRGEIFLMLGLMGIEAPDV